MTLTDSTNDQFMALAGIRYCLAGRSYASGIGRQWLLDSWDQITNHTRSTIVRDLVERLMDSTDNYPLPEADRWREVGRFCWNSLHEKQQQRVRQQVAHKPQEWPL